MAIVRYNPRFPHRPWHDLEAFFWVLLFIFLRNAPHLTILEHPNSANPRLEALKLFDHAHAHKTLAAQKVTTLENLADVFRCSIAPLAEVVLGFGMMLRWTNGSIVYAWTLLSVPPAKRIVDVAALIRDIDQIRPQHSNVLGILSEQLTGGDWAHDGPAQYYQVRPRVLQVSTPAMHEDHKKDSAAISEASSPPISETFPIGLSTSFA